MSREWVSQCHCIFINLKDIPVQEYEILLFGISWLMFFLYLDTQDNLIVTFNLDESFYVYLILTGKPRQLSTFLPSIVYEWHRGWADFTWILLHMGPFSFVHFSQLCIALIYNHLNLMYMLNLFHKSFVCMILVLCSSDPVRERASFN